MVMIAEGPRRARRASVNVVDEGVAATRADRGENVGEAERWVSVAGGAALAMYGLRRRDWAGFGLALAGALLVERARSGHCPVYGTLGVTSAGGLPRRVRGESGRDDVTGAAATVNARKAVKVEHSVTINRPAQELYDFWRDFAQLPQFMTHLESVTVLDDRRSHWVAKAPAGTQVEWDAEIVNEIPGQLIAWKSVAHADVANAGSVHFQTAPGGRGTEVKVVLDYEPPAGRLGALAAKLLHEEPDTQVREDLRRFKQLMEAGELATTEGQPAGRR